MLPLLACGGGNEPAGRASAPASPAPIGTPAPSPAGGAGYTVVEVKDGGRIMGRVLYRGTPPESAPIPVTKDHEICGTAPKRSESLVVGPAGGLRNAVVSIGPIARGKGFPPGSRAALDQHGCWFVPHLLVAPAGAAIDIVNSDGILHNLHAFPTNNQPFNVAQPKFKRVITETFARPDIVRIACDVHPWMNGWIIVAADPYRAVTAADGSFSLDDVPPGTYTLGVWHETLGRRDQAITVAPGGTTEVTITFGT